MLQVNVLQSSIHCLIIAACPKFAAVDIDLLSHQIKYLQIEIILLKSTPLLPFQGPSSIWTHISVFYMPIFFLHFIAHPLLKWVWVRLLIQGQRNSIWETTADRRERTDERRQTTDERKQHCCCITSTVSGHKLRSPLLSILTTHSRTHVQTHI